MEDAKFYNTNPTISDKMHGILFVADVEKLDCEESESENVEMILKVADYSELLFIV